MRNAFTLPSKTYIELDQPEIYQRFMQGYFQLLRENLQSYKAMDQDGGAAQRRHPLQSLRLLHGAVLHPQK